MKNERLMSVIDGDFSDYIYNRELQTEGCEDAAEIEAGNVINKLLCLVKRSEMQESVETIFRLKRENKSVEEICYLTGLPQKLVEFILTIPIDDDYSDENGALKCHTDDYRQGFCKAKFDIVYSLRGNGFNKNSIKKIVNLTTDIVEILLNDLPNFYG